MSSLEWRTVLHIDIETYSDVDIKAGVYRYSEGEGFEVLLFAYAFDDEPVTVLDLTKEALPREVVDAILDPTVLKKAHNASFERICLSRHLQDTGDFTGKYLPPESWYCTMVHSVMCGFPAKLERVGKAMKLSADEIKLDTGTALINFFCKNCRATKANGGRTRNLAEHDPEKWSLFIEYNRRDVETERVVEDRLTSIYKMPDKELERYWIDQRIADTGVPVDMELVQSVLNYWQDYSARLAQEAKDLAGINIKSVMQLKEWLLEEFGIKATSFDKTHLPQLIEASKDYPDAKRVLIIRQLIGGTSIKKYEVFPRSTCKDGRLHGILQFYGSRTGRWAGRMVQPQNLPRNAIANFDVDRQLVKAGDWDLIEDFYMDPQDVVKTLIRTVLIPPAGHKYAIADFSAIEARVIAWLADEKWRLEAFHNGEDIYCVSASQMYGVPLSKHGPNGHLRKQGKIAELALGYGGGIGALCAFGADKVMTEAEMSSLIQKWRQSSPRLTKLWSTFERWFRCAIYTDKEAYEKHRQKVAWKVCLDGNLIETTLAVSAEKAINNVRWRMFGAVPESELGIFTAICGDDSWTRQLDQKVQMWTENNVMHVTLPSGRELIYQNPHLAKEPGKDEPGCCFDGVVQGKVDFGPVFTWGGKITENIVQAIARDCLAETIDRIAERHPEWPIEFHVHDEVIVEVPEETADECLQELLDIMAEPISWAPGLELKGAGFVADYYQKD